MANVAHIKSNVRDIMLTRTKYTLYAQAYVFSVKEYNKEHFSSICPWFIDPV